MKLPRYKRILFALVAMAGSSILILAALFGADLYAHSRVEASVSFNRFGYRGREVGRKRPGETRIVMLGGSTVHGFDVRVDETLPAQLERELLKTGANVSVVNLGYIGEGAYAFVPTLRSYEYLDSDIVLLYEGYNDLWGDAKPNTILGRHASPVFRMTGYFPVLPLVLRDKAAFLRGRPDPSQAVFRPGLSSSASAAALDATAAIADAFNRSLDSIVDPVESRPHTGPGCPSPWSHYCRSVSAAVQYALSHGKRVIVIGQPRLRYRTAYSPDNSFERHTSQQRALSEMLARDFAGDGRVRYLDMGNVVDTSDVSLAFDGMHLNARGNGIVAAALAPAVLAH